MSSLVSLRSARVYCAHESRLLKSLTRIPDGDRFPASTTFPRITKLPATVMSLAIGGVPPTLTRLAAAPSHFFGMSVLLTPTRNVVLPLGKTAKRAGLSASFVKENPPEMSLHVLPTSLNHLVSVAATVWKAPPAFLKYAPPEIRAPGPGVAAA